MLPSVGASKHVFCTMTEKPRIRAPVATKRMSMPTKVASTLLTILNFYQRDREYLSCVVFFFLPKQKSSFLFADQEYSVHEFHLLLSALLLFLLGHLASFGRNAAIQIRCDDRRPRRMKGFADDQYRARGSEKR